MIDRRTFLRGAALVPVAPLVNWVPEPMHLVRWRNTRDKIVSYSVKIGRKFVNIGGYWRYS